MGKGKGWCWGPVLADKTGGRTGLECVDWKDAKAGKACGYKSSSRTTAGATVKAAWHARKHK